MKKASIWISASVTGGRGNGGYGVVMKHDGKRVELSDHGDNVTSNEMQFRGIRDALRLLDHPTRITIYTKSRWAANVLAGQYNLKASHLVSIFDEIRYIVCDEGHVVHAEVVPRGESNVSRAHDLAKKERLDQEVRYDDRVIEEESCDLPDCEIWTDGSSTGGRGIGGWAAIIKFDDEERIVAGGTTEATNNSMEFMAIVRGISSLSCPHNVTVYSDSALAIGAFSKGFDMNAPHLAKIQEEYMRVVEHGKHRVRFVKVKGHSGIWMNERADKLAGYAKEVVA